MSVEPAIAGLVRTFRQDGCVLMKGAVAADVVDRLRSVYGTASEARNHTTFPVLDSVGPLMSVSLLGGQDRHMLRHAASPDTAPQPARTYGLQCRSMKQLLRIEKWFKKRFPGNVMTEEEMEDQWKKDAAHVKSPVFDAQMKQRMYVEENMNFHQRMGTHRYNLFLTDARVRSDVYRPNSGVPFETVRQLTGALGLRVWAEDYLTRKAYANAVPLHSFLPFVGVTNTRGEVEMRGAAVYVFLDDVSYDQGAFCILKGSHELIQKRFPGLSGMKSAVSHPVSFDFGKWRKTYPELMDLAVDSVTPSRGDVLVVQHSAVCGWGANMSKRPWDGLCYHVIPDGSVFAGVRNSWVSKELMAAVPRDTTISDDGLFPKCASD